jgi:NAD(P)-dependent dehydrogenase (short-subunit alcohol dehydrogenase family)
LACDVNLKGCTETVGMIAGTGGKAHAFAVDVTDAFSCTDLAQFAQSTMGGIDALINNAALYGGLERRFFEEIDEAVWDRVMSVNVKGVWQMCRAFSPALRTAKGAIVNIASATVFSGSPQWMHYVTSKGAVIAMSRTMAKEMGPDGVRVNVIAPGFTLTEASFGHINDARSYGIDRASLKRPAEVEDITGGALWLASPLSSYMTGQTMVIDGGRQFI